MPLNRVLSGPRRCGARTGVVGLAATDDSSTNGGNDGFVAVVCRGNAGFGSAGRGAPVALGAGIGPGKGLGRTGEMASRAEPSPGVGVLRAGGDSAGAGSAPSGAKPSVVSPFSPTGAGASRRVVGGMAGGAAPPPGASGEGA